MMKTLVLSTEKEDIEKAGEILKNGGLVAIPTETVYGLAANALDSQAIKKIFIAKGRPSDNPLIVHIQKFSDISPLVKNIPEKARILAEKFWPGPLTMVLPKSDIIPKEITGGLDSVAIRVPKSETARMIIKSANCPLAAPSANLSGKPSPTKFEHIAVDLKGRVDAMINGEDCAVGLESTVISFCTEVPKILRPGGVSAEEIRAVIGEIEIDKAVLQHVENLENVASPGMKYKHYSPKAKIVLSELSFVDFQNLFKENKKAKALCFDGEEIFLETESISYGARYDSLSQAKNLFSALYETDQKGFDFVYARAPKKTGVGLAVYNRIIRACGFDVLKPKCKIVGLTGTTGSGKSTVAKELKKQGFPIVDCDKITKEKDTYSPLCLKKLAEYFGKDIAVNGELNRRLLAERAFVSKKETQKLNDICFPFIMEKVIDKINKYKENKSGVIILDAPTLFEANLDNFCTYLLVVTADINLRCERIVKRDGLSKQEAMTRISSQHNSEFFVDRADFVIDTSENEYIAQTNQFIKQIKED
ncbi:MAG: L-threonylcarbamoyladenylate synthase [Clostridia bacterium]